LGQLTPDLIAMGLTTYVVLLFSLSFHEAAHAWAALRMGDDTALRQGRISLNPTVHIDPMGTVLLPLVMFLTTGSPLFGWAKPTPYDPASFRRDRSMAAGHLVVAGAGPLSNLVLALCCTAGLYVVLRMGLPHSHPAVIVFAVGVQVNVLLALFNMVPLPPLDGSKLAAWGLPRALGDAYVRIVEPYGGLLLMILFVMPYGLGALLMPFVSFLTHLLFQMAR